MALFCAVAVLAAGCNRTRETPPPSAVAVERSATPFCPDMQIRAGEEARVVYDRTNTTDPERVRHQAAILTIGRNCFRTGDAITAEFTVGGRIVAGPRGAGGTVSAPLRVTLVQEGVGIIFSRVYTVSGSIAAPAYGANFTVADTIAVPGAAPVGSLILFVGFDQP